MPKENNMRHLRQYGLFILFLVLVLTCSFALLACGEDNDDGESDADVLKIRIENLPEKSVYSGDEISLEDATILATTRGGAILSVPITQDMLSGFDTNTLGEQTITISYEGCTATFTVNVLKPEVQSISISERPSVISVVQGGSLSLTGVKLKVQLQSRSIIIDNINMNMVRGYSKDLPVGEHTIFIDYAGFSAELEIEVLPKSVVSIEIITIPKDTQYFVGEPFNPAGLSVKRMYDNGTEDVIRYEDDATLFSFECDDEKFREGFTEERSSAVITVIVGGQSATFNDCVVKNPIVKSFKVENKYEISTLPIILNERELVATTTLNNSIVQGTKINWKTGLGSVTYDNGDSIDINLANPSIYLYYDSLDEENRVSTEFALKDTGDHNIYLRYGNSDAYDVIQISVKARTPKELLLGDIRPEGERIEDRVFIDGSRLSTAFLRYNILYDNATYEWDVNDVTTWGALLESMLDDDPENPSTLNLSVDNLDEGKQLVNFTISGVTAGFKIKVIEKVARSITVNAPYKNIYAVGSPLEFAGSYIYVQYNDNSFERISPIPESIVALYDKDGNMVNNMSFVGEYTAKVSFAGLESSFKVNAVESKDIVTAITLTERRKIDLGDGSVSTTNVDMPLDETYSYANFDLIPFDNIFMNITTGAGSSTEDPPCLAEAELIEGDRFASGKQTLLFRYQGFLFNLNIDIEGRRVSSIEVSKAPNKSVYVLGTDTELDITGLLVTKVFNDGDRGEQNYFDSLWSFSGYDLTKVGVQQVIVTYVLGDRTYNTSFDIEVAELSVASISFDDTQNGVETFEIVNDDGTREMFRGIKVSYRDDINLTYIHNYFDHEGLPVTEIHTLYFNVTYENGMVVQRELKASYISYDKNVNPNVSGDFKYEAKISYGGQITSMNLYVAFRKLASIEVYNLPNVVTYAEGQTLSREGGYILRRFDDGTTDILPMTNGLIGVDGYDANPFINVQGGTYLDQDVTLSYGNKTTTFTVRTYRKLVAAPTIGNSIFSYGDVSVPVITIRESIAGFEIPSTTLEYWVDGAWVSERPVYPGTYPLRIMVHENEYYVSDVVEDASLSLIIRKKAIIIKIDAVSKVYKEADPRFTYIIEDGELVGNDYVDIEITREPGEDVKYVGTGSNRVIGSYAITAKLTEGGANNNALYELAYEQVGLTIKPRTVTVNKNNVVINVEFTAPSNYNPVNQTIPYTGLAISGFTAKYTDAEGFISMIEAKDILYYDANGNLLTGLPKERGDYQVRISDNYSFQGTSMRNFTIV